MEEKPSEKPSEQPKPLPKPFIQKPKPQNQFDQRDKGKSKPPPMKPPHRPVGR